MSRRRSKSPRRSRDSRRSRSRHRSRSRRKSRSPYKSKERHRSQSQRKSSDKTMEKENLKTGWDSIELPRSKPPLRTDNVFAKSSLIKKDINIRLQSQSTTIPVAKKDEKQSQNPTGATLSLLSRWETVPAPRNEEINNLTKLCAEISANDGDKYKMRKEVAHPFNVKEAPIHIPYSRYRTPTVSNLI